MGANQYGPYGKGASSEIKTLKGLKKNKGLMSTSVGAQIKANLKSAKREAAMRKAMFG